MGGRGASFGSAERKIRETVSKEENRIRNFPVEHASVIGTDGTVILMKTENLADSVSFTSAESSMFKNTVFTHNHPNGSTFSPEDLNLAVTTAVREMRACNANGYFSLKRTFEIGAYVPQKYFNFSKDYEKAVNKYKKTVTDVEWAKSAQTASDADRLNNKLRQYREDWLKSNSASYGWQYTEGKTK